MIDNDPIKVIALMSALTAVSPATAQTNKLQERHRQFLTEEFRKVDKNLQDFFISPEELNSICKITVGLRRMNTNFENHYFL